MGFPPRVRRPRLAALRLAAVLLALACRPGEAPGPAAGVLFDPRFVAIDLAAPFTRFDGSYGTLLLADGWASYEELGGGILGAPLDFAWVLDGKARIYLERPPAAKIDFYARCMPYPPESAEPQELILEGGGRILGRQELADGWQQVRIALPSDALRAKWITLRLRFRHATSPQEAGESADERRLSAAFREVAVVPRRLDDPETFLAATRLDPEQRRLRLAKGGVVGIPLPASSEVTLNLGRMAADGAWGCHLRLELGRGGRTVWEGTAADAAAAKTVSFSTPENDLRRLRLSLHGCGASEYDPGTAVEMPFGPEELEIRRAARRRPRSKPHVFIYLIDTLRADSLSVYGSRRPASPRLQEFARDAVTYDDAWSPSAWTLPAVVSLMTGVYPDRHRVSLGLPRLRNDAFPTLATRLKKLGYATLGISQSFIASRKFGLHQGFDTFFLSDQLSGSQLRSQEVRTYLLQWLVHRPNPTLPVFAYIHTVDPHSPYLPAASDMAFADQVPRTLADESYDPTLFLTAGYGPDSVEVERLRALYDGEVAYADRQLGRFLDMLRFLGLYDSSVVVVLSDHGEEFGEHGGFSHGRAVYEEMLRVPLLVKYPRSAGAGTRLGRQVTTIDVTATLLRLAGGGADAGNLDGRVLPPLAADGAGPAGRFVYSEVETLPGENVVAVHYRAFRLGGVKCIESVTGQDQFGRAVPRWRAFDLDADPREERPLAAADPLLERCRETLGRWLESRAGPSRQEPRQDFDAATRERLRALGYVN